MGKTKVTNNYNIQGGTISFSVTYKVEYCVAGTEDWVDMGEVTVTNTARQNFRRIFRVDGLEPNCYDIRVTRISANPTANQAGDINLSAIDEIRNENIAYVNSALLAIHMLADNQISGSIPNVSCIVRGKKLASGDPM